jgi:hypothetical protein
MPIAERSVRRRNRSAGERHAQEDDMPANRSRTAKAGLPVTLIVFAAFVLSACVQSEKPLLAGSKPLLGMRFQLTLYQDFADGKARSVKTSVFRWSDDHYALASGDSSGVQYFVVQSFDGGNLLIEANEHGHVYLLGRKLANGTYGIVPIDENDVDEATRDRTCVTRNPVICTIQTRRQLDVFVRAAAKKRGTVMAGAISGTAR